LSNYDEFIHAMIPLPTMAEPRNPLQYCHSLTGYERLRTHSVRIGGLEMGGENAIRIQSMTTTDTLDTLSTVAQSIRMIEAGCELVRITAPSKKEAENLEPIRAALRAQGYVAPLVADIHFTPNAAEVAAKLVEKVRVNPGNYADKKKFEELEYTDAAYAAELNRLRKRFAPLVELCKQHGTAMRIGTNHGSLSDRIMSRYGDSPEGMVASALEFVDVCEDLNYHALVISMKASNVLVMVHAYRLLVHELLQRGHCYPLHLGVTEAGDGEDGRIKSALGIGALLLDGLGDTIRVSLTEAPEAEMPAAMYIRDHYLHRTAEGQPNLPEVPLPINPFGFQRRHTHAVEAFGGDNVPRVIADFSRQGSLTTATDLAPVGHQFSAEQDKWTMTDMGADFLFGGHTLAPFMLPSGLRGIYNAQVWAQATDTDHEALLNKYPYFGSIEVYTAARETHPTLNFVRLRPTDFNRPNLVPELEARVVLVLHDEPPFTELTWRNVLFRLMHLGIHAPVVVRHNPQPMDHHYGPNHTPQAAYQMSAACALAQLCVDGLVDGIWLTSPAPALFNAELCNRTAFGILQAARLRITKTEYISCPSCGRTLFDLEETTARIRRRTEHLKGVKIGIMGCIVNGPGEMADADYGYVGSGPGVITLYRGKEVVRHKVPTADAVDALVEIIAEDGRWFERVA
jgi:(E)-4-hydroxy-3-methylbut-2-enyl-diphosphate synthase